MEERFIYLLRAHVEHLATEQEQLELKALIRTDQYNHLLRDDIAQSLLQQVQEEDGELNYPVDPDAIFANVLDRVRESIPDFPRRRNLTFLWVAAAALLLGMGVTWWFVARSSFSGSAIGIASDQMDENIRFNRREFIHLPDGSTVQLNDSSEIWYSPSFGKQIREVTLTGEAYFDIKPDATHPFIIHTGKVKTKVLGTAFNIKTHQGYVTVTVTRGMVEVGSENKIFGKLKPRQQMKVDSEAVAFEMSTVKPQTEVKWIENNLIFDNISLEECAELISKRFKVQVTILNQEIKKCRISAGFVNKESLDDILQMVTGIRQATYTVENDRVYIDGGISCD